MLATLLGKVIGVAYYEQMFDGEWLQLAESQLATPGVLEMSGSSWPRISLRHESKVGQESLHHLIEGLPALISHASGLAG